MTTCIVSCIASYDQSSGQSEGLWFTDAGRCQERFNAMKQETTGEYATRDLMRFDLTVNDLDDPQNIESLVDDAVKNKEFRALERRMLSIQGQALQGFTYTTAYWKQITDEMRCLNEGFRQHLIETALPVQLAFSNLMERYEGNPVGIECKADYREAWGFVAPNVVNEYSKHPWRIQTFDEKGMCGHECYDSFIDAVEALVRSYRVPDAGALDRVSSSVLWAVGLEVQVERDRLNRGEISFKEFLDRSNAIHAKLMPKEVALAD